MKQRKLLSTHRFSELKETPSWATVGPAKDKHKALTYRWKFYAMVVNESEDWPTVKFMHFLLQNDVCSALQMKLKLIHWNTNLSLNINFSDFRFWTFRIEKGVFY